MRKRTFKGGIHPFCAQNAAKSFTREKAIREFTSDSVCIPLDMHIGAPSVPVVKRGDHVRIGQLIGEAQGTFGVPVHASVSGKVTAVGPIQQFSAKASACITIENDFADEWVELKGYGSVESIPADEIVPAIRDAGICGMGGAGFPTHVKLTIPEGKSIDTVILNGCECETCLTCDHRLMLESPGRVVDGLRAVMRALRVPRGIIAIEDNKMNAVAAVKKAAEGREGIEVVVLQTKYPQGGEKQLIQATLQREVPSGGLPMDVHAVVVNVGTASAITDAIVEGKPLISRVTTVTGLVKEPCNLLLRVGTVFSHAVTGCGGYTEEPGMIVAGGTMNGIAAPDENVSMTKTTNGIMILGEKEARAFREDPCIRCSRCVTACPAGLRPYRLNEFYHMGDLDAMDKEHVRDCILCGACSYVCPSRRWLVASFRIGKEDLARRDSE